MPFERQSDRVSLRHVIPQCPSFKGGYCAGRMAKKGAPSTSHNPRSGQLKKTWVTTSGNFIMQPQSTMPFSHVKYISLFTCLFYSQSQL